MKLERLLAHSLQLVKVIDTRSDRESFVNESLCRAENEIALCIVLEVLIGLIADTHGTVAHRPVALKAR